MSFLFLQLLFFISSSAFFFPLFGSSGWFQRTWTCAEHRVREDMHSGCEHASGRLLVQQRTFPFFICQAFAWKLSSVVQNDWFSVLLIVKKTPNQYVQNILRVLCGNCSDNNDSTRLE